MMMLPNSPKLFYGIFSDTFSICGSRKRSYLILFSCIQILSAGLVVFSPEPDYMLIFYCSTTIYFSQAFMDVVIDGLTVQQQKIDQENGSNDLQTVSWGSQVAGGLLFGTAGGIILEKFHERYVFVLVGILGFLILIVSIKLDPELEEANKEIGKMGLCERVKTVFGGIKEGLRVKALFRILLYMVLLNVLTPGFGDYFYAYMNSILEFSQL
jgi:MFS family permease